MLARVEGRTGTLTFPSGSRNIQPDAAEEPCMDPEHVLLPSCLIATLTWEIELTVLQGQGQMLPATTGLLNRLFVPDSRVLMWAHSTRLTCHPGITRTLDFLRQRFWRAIMDKATRSLLAACSTCGQNKSSTRPRLACSVP